MNFKRIRRFRAYNFGWFSETAHSIQWRIQKYNLKWISEVREYNWSRFEKLKQMISSWRPEFRYGEKINPLYRTAFQNKDWICVYECKNINQVRFHEFTNQSCVYVNELKRLIAVNVLELYVQDYSCSRFSWVVKCMFKLLPNICLEPI